MIREGIEVTFSACISPWNSCTCDMCGAVNHVIKVRRPKTLYHDGYNLSAVYSEMWMCERCRDRLVSVISIPFPVEDPVEINPAK